jgi:hypothetical protein
MKFSRTSWLILGIGILIVAAISLYMLYRGQISEQESLNDSLANENATIQLISIQMQALEGELAQMEIDLAELEGENSQLEAEISQLEDELSQLEAEREQAIAQAQLLLNEAEARFFSSVESIEYDEVLFGFAHDANLTVESLITSETKEEDVEGITYTATAFTIKVWGEVADIINFVNTVVTDEAFKTTILGPVNMEVPEPLTDNEKEDIEGAIRAGFTAEAIAELTTEDMVGFILEAIAEVAGPEAGTDYDIEPEAVEDMAQTIKEKIDEQLVEEDFVDLLSGDLAQLIEEHIQGSIIEVVVSDLAGKIANLWQAEEGEFQDLEGLLGKGINNWLGEQIAGSLESDIKGLLREYISNLVEEKMMDSAAELVDDELVAELAAEQVKAMETPSSDITLVIYTYEGE